eukprot:gb/GECG01010682.1/.p1 GENE.gb/GECG01010682.1/~~gb/GECG01010682.1/.p1  ORF type:complete len:358 (+),score=40.95 gb/GECG01010682.1/:1-1074(+)
MVLQPVHILQQVLHTKDEGPIGPVSELLHHIVDSDEITDISRHLVVELFRRRIEVYHAYTASTVGGMLLNAPAIRALASSSRPHDDLGVFHGYTTVLLEIFIISYIPYILLSYQSIPSNMGKPLYLLFKPPGVSSTSAAPSSSSSSATDKIPQEKNSGQESKCHYALFQVVGQEPQKFKIRKAKKSFEEFRKLVTMKALLEGTGPATGEHESDTFEAFKTGKLSEALKQFLKDNLPRAGTQQYLIGVLYQDTAKAIKEELGLPCMSGGNIGELIRGIFPNFSKLLQEYHSGDNISLDNSLTRSTGKRARAQDSTLDTHGKDKAQSKSTKHGSSFAASNKRQKKGRRAKKRKMATETA